MAQLTPKRIDLSQINNGNEYNPTDGVQSSAVNSAVEASAYAQNFAESFADEPDNSEIANVGIPSVSIVNNIKDGITYKKFKFSNLKGETGKTGISIKNVEINEKSESSTESTYSITVYLENDTVIDAGEIVIPKTSIPVITEFGEQGQVTPSEDLMVGGFFLKEV